MVVIPYPVDEQFLTGDVPTAADRADRIVAIGRWDDSQKDGPLLAAAIERVAAVRPKTEFVVIGRNGTEVFSRLCKQVARVRYLGVQPPSVIGQFLRASRTLALSSGWESGPIVASEALCAGCSLVGPAWVPTIPWYCGEGAYGTVFERRSASALAGALAAELAEWDIGGRDPRTISAYFRPWFTPASVCRSLLTGRCGEPN